MASAGRSGGAAAREGARRVSFLFRRTQGAGHCAGVNALALSSDEQHLWTGSRDAIVKCWDTSAERPLLKHDHVGHIDWVNDLALVGDVLVSCSSDKTLRVWQPDLPDPALGCLTGHTDYVTGLAASQSGSMLASGGLRGEVLLWDLAGLRQVMSGAVQNQEYGASAADVPRDSVYAIGMNGAGTLVATGSTQCIANVVDVRSGRLAMQLKGHTDNIRALQLDTDGRLMLTGSSDHTIRLWDLGQQRCVQTLAVHTDSVWALWASPSFSAVYSGGRDGCIYRTRLANRVSELLACEEHPVVRLAVGRNEDFLWAATTSPEVHKWKVEAGEAAALPLTPRSPLGAAGAALPGSSSCFVASPSAAARARLVFDLQGAPVDRRGEGSSCSRPAAQQLQPAAATPGIPPIQQAAVLTDRRHVLTQDAAGDVLMWDVTSGAAVRDFGRCELREVEKELFQPSHSVSAWFAPEVKLGSLAGSMEAPQCFGAEVYAQDLGDAEAPIDLKINFGEQMLIALFRQWAALQRQGQQQQQQQQQQPQQGQEQQQQHDGPVADGGNSGSRILAGSPPGSADGEAGTAAQQRQGAEDSSMHDAHAGGGGAAPLPPAPASRFSFHGSLSPVVMVSGSGSSVPWCCPIDSFTGEEDAPQWVAECVLNGHFPLSRELKMAFQLLPLPGSGLPSLLQSKLNAPRVLRINKVSDYVRRKMEEHGIHLQEEPLYWDPAKAEQWQAEQAAAAAGAAGAGASVHQLHPVAGGPGSEPRQAPTLLLTCNGHAVPYDFSLAAVKQWIFKRSDDLVLHYSVRDSTPLKLPAIRPP
ncbi:hypothetical protein ABPG75_001191 [Micractinium tetrahymenae]